MFIRFLIGSSRIIFTRLEKLSSQKLYFRDYNAKNMACFPVDRSASIMIVNGQKTKRLSGMARGAEAPPADCIF